LSFWEQSAGKCSSNKEKGRMEIKYVIGNSLIYAP
jgi:hypothetical protein